MISLYQPAPAWGVLNASPFCMKLELYLRLAKIPYETKLANPLKAPNGKVPYIKDGDQTIGDSSFIIAMVRTKS